MVSDGDDVALFGLGTFFEMAAETKKLLEAKGLSVALINPRWIKPMDHACIEKYAEKASVICTFEDHVLHNGFGCGVMEHLSEKGIYTPIVRIGWPDEFIEHGTIPILREKHGVTAENAVKKITAALARFPKSPGGKAEGSPAVARIAKS